MAVDLSKHVVSSKKGTTLFAEGDPGKEMYFIQQGRVRIEKDIDGKIEVLATMEKGDFFGEMAIIEDIVRTASAIVEEDAKLLKIDRDNFEKLLQSNIEIAVRMIKKYASRLRQSNDRLTELVKDRKKVDQEIESILDSVQKTPKSAKVLATLSLLKGDKTFEISRNETTIGRLDPVTNAKPDIDLTEADSERSVSRRHALLNSHKGEFTLTEQVNVGNGTFINNKKLGANTPGKLESGATIKIGYVDLLFEIK